MKAGDHLLEFLRETLETDDEQILNTLASQAEFIWAAKGTKLYEAGETMEYIHFLSDGIVRMYYMNAKGEEITEWLLDVRGAAVYPCFDLGEDAYARASCDVITDCELVVIPLTVFRTLIETSQEFERLRVRMLQKTLDLQAKLKRSMWHLMPSERYAWLVENRPRIVDSVPQKYIASYLGMTPVSLSRIRSRFKQKEA